MDLVISQMSIEVLYILQTWITHELNLCVDTADKKLEKLEEEKEELQRHTTHISLMQKLPEHLNILIDFDIILVGHSQGRDV